MKIGILNYGIGNIHSLSKALKTATGLTPALISRLDEGTEFDTLILPGVGAFSPAMKKIKALNFDKLIEKHALDGKKIIGVCLGMQLLFDYSDEGEGADGLGLVSGGIKKLKKSDRPFENTPSIGWQKVNFREAHINSDGESDRFYFVHSFHAIPNSSSTIMATYNRNGQKIVAGVQTGNLFGFQFHPEKSCVQGLRLLREICAL